MSCFAPVTGYRPLNGSVKLTFHRNEGFVDKPIKVACGSCVGCRREKARQWSVRCMHEAQMHDRNSFLTLTYSDENLPADKSLNPRDWQIFAKRLRYLEGPFRYFQCGEYGEETQRQHHHALIFGLDFFEDRKHHKTTKGGHKLYIAETLNEIWGHGHVYIGELTQQSANYVALYTLKKHTGPLSTYTYGERVDQDTGELDYYRKPPYATMSRRPGIGAKWFEKYHSDVFPRDEVIANGKKTKPPAFYDYLLELSDPAALDQVKAERRRNGNKHKTNNTPDRLAVREEIILRRGKDYQRDGN